MQDTSQSQLFQTLVENYFCDLEFVFISSELIEAQMRGDYAKFFSLSIQYFAKRVEKNCGEFTANPVEEIIMIGSFKWVLLLWNLIGKGDPKLKFCTWPLNEFLLFIPTMCFLGARNYLQRFLVFYENVLIEVEKALPIELTSFREEIKNLQALLRNWIVSGCSVKDFKASRQNSASMEELFSELQVMRKTDGMYLHENQKVQAEVHRRIMRVCQGPITFFEGESDLISCYMKIYQGHVTTLREAFSFVTKVLPTIENKFQESSKSHR